MKQDPKALAKKTAQQIAQEPLEILKQAQKLVVAVPEPEFQGGPAAVQEPQLTEQQKAKIQAQGTSQLQALENELKEIRVLKEQEKAVTTQKEEQAKVVEARAQEKPIVEPVTRPSQKLPFFGKKTHAERLKTHVERIPPVSG